MEEYSDINQLIDLIKTDARTITLFDEVGLSYTMQPHEIKSNGKPVLFFTYLPEKVTEPSSLATMQGVTNAFSLVFIVETAFVKNYLKLVNNVLQGWQNTNDISSQTLHKGNGGGPIQTNGSYIWWNEIYQYKTTIKNVNT